MGVYTGYLFYELYTVVLLYFHPYTIYMYNYVAQVLLPIMLLLLVIHGEFLHIYLLRFWRLLCFLHHIIWLVEVKDSLFRMLLSPSVMTNFDVMEIRSMFHIKRVQFDAIQ